MSVNWRCEWKFVCARAWWSRVARSALGGAPPLGAMSEGTDEAVEWLGEVVEGRSLTEHCAAVLKAGFEGGVWTLDEVQEDGTLDEASYKDVVELWKCIYADSVKEAAKTKKDTAARAVDTHKLLKWLEARYHHVLDEDESKKKDEVS